MVIPVGTGIFRASAEVRLTGWFSMPNPHIWDRTKNEMDIVTIRAGSEFNCNFDFRVFVAFNDIEIVDGKPVRNVIHAIGSAVQSVLMAMEAESRRLGFVK